MRPHFEAVLSFVVAEVEIAIEIAFVVAVTVFVSVVVVIERAQVEEFGFHYCCYCCWQSRQDDRSRKQQKGQGKFLAKQLGLFAN